MGVGDPGLEQFRDAIVEFRNTDIMAACSPLMDLRREVVGNDEFTQRGGLDSTTQRHLIKHLQVADKWRRVITYQTEDEEYSDFMRKAISTANLIGTDKVEGQKAQGDGAPLVSGEKPFTGDEVQSAPGRIRQFPFALDGSNDDIPLNSKLNFRNNNGLLLLQAIDGAIVDWTRLESRHQTRRITPGDSMRIFQRYVEILEFLEIFGGDGNRVDFAVGVLPSEEPRGTNASPNVRGEDPGKSGIPGPLGINQAS